MTHEIGVILRVQPAGNKDGYLLSFFISPRENREFK